MPRENPRAPGRGLRRPPRDLQKDKQIQAFVEGSAKSDIPDVRDVLDVSNIQDDAKVTPLPQRQAPPEQTPGYASDVVRNDGRKLRRTTLYLQPHLHERLKKAARLTGSDNSTLVNDLLEAHLEKLIQDAIHKL